MMESLQRVSRKMKECCRHSLYIYDLYSLYKNSHVRTAYVKSNTIIGDPKHTAGVVMAEVVLGNIPVKNGVVHLIQRPLMVVDTTVAKFLEVRKHFIPSLCRGGTGVIKKLIEEKIRIFF